MNPSDTLPEGTQATAIAVRDGVRLQVKQLAKRFYIHERDKEIRAFEHLNFRVEAGRITTLVGPSGSGKSSVLKCIYGTYRASHGQLDYLSDDGRHIDLCSCSEHELLELRRREISFVTQFLDCLPRQSTVDVVARPLCEQGLCRETSRMRATQALEAVGLPEHLWEISPYTFSGGEKQRVNLARAFATTPRLLLLDEPTASLDTRMRDRVASLIKAMSENGTAILAIFHDPNLVDQLAHHRVEL